jgi:hypothetical protein
VNHYCTLRHRVQTGSGSYPTTHQRVPAALSPSSADVKNIWIYTSTPPCVFMAWYLVKPRDNFSLSGSVKYPVRKVEESLVKKWN